MLTNLPVFGHGYDAAAPFPECGALHAKEELPPGDRFIETA
ncbi:hypothetical protein ACFV4E_33460 [Streptomyces hygroscopicus]